MKKLLVVIITALLTACSADNKAAELLETARFEEKQNNREHAVKLYEEIVSKYAASPSAAEAKKRLETLKPAKP